MQRTHSRRPVVKSSTLIALAAAMLLLGGGFLVAYDALRGSNLSAGDPDNIEAPAPRGPDDYVPRSDDQALIEMGIDPENNDLSPQALAAITRAHRAAREAGARQAAGVETGAAEAGAEPAADPGATPDE